MAATAAAVSAATRVSGSALFDQHRRWADAHAVLRAAGLDRAARLVCIDKLGKRKALGRIQLALLQGAKLGLERLAQLVLRHARCILDEHVTLLASGVRRGGLGGGRGDPPLSGLPACPERSRQALDF